MKAAPAHLRRQGWSKFDAGLFTIRRVYCGANLLPQCLHFRASRKTNSRQSGHLTCVSGFGPSETISRFLVTSTKMSPSSGEMKSDRKNQPIPLRPRLWARIPTATENKGQKITYSMTTLFFGKFKVYSLFGCRQSQGGTGSAPCHSPKRASGFWTCLICYARQTLSQFVALKSLLPFGLLGCPTS